jgi:DNA-binding CsgD family transcriptional regulator
VHGGYLYRLRQKIAGLTPSETRFMALAKLNLNNKEMAASLGVGPNAIRNTWFRLRKKLNLPEEYSLKEFVKTI